MFAADFLATKGIVMCLMKYRLTFFAGNLMDLKKVDTALRVLVHLCIFILPCNFH